MNTVTFKFLLKQLRAAGPGSTQLACALSVVSRTVGVFNTQTGSLILGRHTTVLTHPPGNQD